MCDLFSREPRDLLDELDGDWCLSHTPVLDMMRYHRLSPDVLPFGNGKKPSIRACKEDMIPDYAAYEGKPFPRARSASASTNSSPSGDYHRSFPSESPLAQCNSQAPPSVMKHINHHNSVGNVLRTDGGGDILLQWGQNKRSRGTRAENRAVVDESVYSRRKVQRRLLAVAAMPPPSFASYIVGDNHRYLTNRASEDRSSGLNQWGKTFRSPEKARETTAKIAQNGCTAVDVSANTESPKRSLDREMGSGSPIAAGVKLNPDKFKWPRIYVSLSRKEKEADFLAMKGTKLPHRPKKRAKNVEKALQFCSPGLWLADLTRSRYEVREKKCVKKKRTGLKAMELDSDSE